VVVLTTTYGTLRRRVYLSLHHAVQAVQRTRERGLHAELILCRLTPVAADLDDAWSELVGPPSFAMTAPSIGFGVAGGKSQDAADPILRNPQSVRVAS
jgi:hypothetical protein